MEIESKYLDAETAQDGDIIEFKDEGSKEIKPSAFGSGNYTNHNFSVFNGRYMQIYTPKSEALSVFIKAWGRDTKAWIGKKFQVKLVDRLVKGVMKKAVFPVIIEQKA